MTHLFLYGTAACHLCEEAAALLFKVGREADISWSEVDVAEDDALLQLYGTKIPVLRRDDSAAVLCWPFSAANILAFIG